MFKLEESFNSYYIKLEEQLVSNIWYHATDRSFFKFQPNWQGIHLADSPEAAQAVMENRLKTNYIIYKVQVNIKNPLEIDCDPMSWGGTTLAHLLYCKLNNINYEGSAGSDYIDSEQEIKTNYRTDLSPDLIHFDCTKLSKGDINAINLINSHYKEKSWSESQEKLWFNILSNIIQKCGYDAILYSLAEDESNKAKALIVFSANNCKILEII